MALRPTTSNAIAWAVSRAEPAMTTAVCDVLGVARGPAQGLVSPERAPDDRTEALDAQQVDETLSARRPYLRR